MHDAVRKRARAQNLRIGKLEARCDRRVGGLARAPHELGVPACAASTSADDEELAAERDELTVVAVSSAFPTGSHARRRNGAIACAAYGALPSVRLYHLYCTLQASL